MRTIGILARAMLCAPGCCSRRAAARAARPRSSRQLQHEADINAIDQIEKTWHRAGSTQNVDLMMTVWAPDATFTVGGEPSSARRRSASSSRPRPGRSSRGTTGSRTRRPTRSGSRSNGDKGTLYFECHYIDAATGKLVNIVAADQDVQKIDGKWLITTSSAAPATLGA